ncbi:acyltransferase [Candidatus Woesebacteria bacterium]|nr:acyltransferase [Candidatus Woesebacteria bacterium]
MNTSLSAKIQRRITAIYLEAVTGFLWWCVGFIPSHHIRRFFYRLFGMSIGSGSTIHMMARIYDPRHIAIGTDTIIGERATLDGRKQLENSEGGLIIGNHVDIASEVMIWTSQHAINDPHFGAIEKEVIVDDYVFIGPRAIILPGVHIGRGAIVAAGAVVTKDVAPLSVVAGIPAKEIAQRETEALGYTLGRARWFQ